MKVISFRVVYPIYVHLNIAVSWFRHAISSLQLWPQDTSLYSRIWCTTCDNNLANVKIKFIGGIRLEEKIHKFISILHLIDYNNLNCHGNDFYNKAKIIHFFALLIFHLIILNWWKLNSEKEMTEQLFCERTERNVLTTLQK